MPRTHSPLSKSLDRSTSTVPECCLAFQGLKVVRFSSHWLIGDTATPLHDLTSLLRFITWWDQRCLKKKLDISWATAMPRWAPRIMLLASLDTRIRPHWSAQRCASNHSLLVIIQISSTKSGPKWRHVNEALLTFLLQQSQHRQIIKVLSSCKLRDVTKMDITAPVICYCYYWHLATCWASSLTACMCAVKHV